MRKWVLAGFAAVLASAEAEATGGFSCSVDDTSLAFTAEAAFSNGNGQPFFDLRAKAELKGKGVPDDYRTIELQDNLRHHWFEAGDLRLRFYHEREGEANHATFELVIKATGKGDDPELAGTYKLTIFNTDPPTDAEGQETLTFEGQAACSAG